MKQWLLHSCLGWKRASFPYLPKLPCKIDLRQVGCPTKRRVSLQGDVGHLTDDLGANIPRGQHHLGCAGDAVGNVVSLWFHVGLGGWEPIAIFEPFQGDVSGGEPVGFAGEAHCLLRCDPHCGAWYHRRRGFGYKRNIYKWWTWLPVSSLMIKMGHS